jgi:hypothetical protein
MIVGLPSCDGGCTELSACLLLPWGVASCRCEGQLLTLDYDIKVSIKLMPFHCLELVLYYILVNFFNKIIFNKIRMRNKNMRSCAHVLVYLRCLEHLKC